MRNQSLVRALAVMLLSATTITVVGCASSKMTSNPQSADPDTPAAKQYNYQDMSLGKSFFGPPMSKSQPAQTSQPQ